MGGMTRQLARERAKNAYRRFCESWTIERSYRQHMIKEGRKDVKDLPRRPTFREWMIIVAKKESAMSATPEAVQEFREEGAKEEDLEWKES